MKLRMEDTIRLREQAERAGQGLDVEALISARMEQVARAENAEAAIERVRELCANRQRCLDPAIKHPTAISIISIDEVLQALDGERDE